LIDNKQFFNYKTRIMTKNNKTAAKAARRAEREVSKSGKVFISDFSSLKDLGMGQTIKRGSATKDPKDIKIGISYLMNAEGSIASINYTTNMDRFTNTYNHVRKHPAGVLEFRTQMYEKLKNLINSNAPIDEYFYTVGMHYLVSFETVRVLLEKLPQEAHGFMIVPNEDGADCAMVFGSDYNYWEYSVLTRRAA
jgi:hypothetical protein